MTDFYLSPLRGITDGVFRRAYERRFGRFDYMVAPFVPTILGKRVRDHHIRDLLPNNNNCINGINVINDINGINNINNGGDGRLIPQIIGRDPTGFLLLSDKFAGMGFPSVNWNLGCPAPLVAKKMRGCGLLPHKDIIKRFLDEVTPKLTIPMSIKARLGYESPTDLEALIPLFNGYPLKELIIHPRIGTQLYGGTVDLDRFEACIDISKHAVVYNGDIVSVNTFRRLSERFPSVNKWMIGRGIVGNPFLLMELREAVSTGSLVSTGSTVLTKSPVLTRSTESSSTELTKSTESSLLTVSTGSSLSTVSTEPSLSTRSTGSTKRTLSTEDIPRVTGFLNDLLDACKDHPRQLKVLGRMKEIWKYLGNGIDGWEELSKKIIQCTSIQEYRIIIDTSITPRP